MAEKAREKQKVVVVGGTGFLGYYAVKEFIRRGHSVTIVALPPLPEEGLFPKEVNIILANIDKLDDSSIMDILKGHDAIVFAAGADDRVIPRTPAYEFFHQANVLSCKRVLSLARQSGIKRGVILSSYFLHFDRTCPEEKLSEHHPYIRSRKEQAQQSMDVSMPDLQLMILELPYIFGSMPGRTPLWKPLIGYINSRYPLFYMKGGTNMIAVEHVGEAIVGAIEKGKGGHSYTVGDQNLTWVEFLERILSILGKKKRIVILPTWTVRLGLRLVGLQHRLRGRESGLDPVRFAAIQTRNTFFDPAPAAEELGYGRGNLEEAFKDTVEACLRVKS
jgi:nucleoside-diphosphate-sugar epimerase